MNWETFYLTCFLVGLLLSVLSLLGGMGHLGGHTHLPHMPHAGHLPHVPGALDVVNGGVGDTTQGGANVPWWNAFSIMIFLCWFGAAGYLLTRHGGLCGRGCAGVVSGMRDGGRSDPVSFPDEGDAAA